MKTKEERFEKDLEKLIIELKELASKYEEKADKSETGSVNGGIFWGKKEAFNYSAKKIENLMDYRSKRAVGGN